MLEPKVPWLRALLGLAVLGLTIGGCCLISDSAIDEHRTLFALVVTHCCAFVGVLGLVELCSLDHWWFRLCGCITMMLAPVVWIVILAIAGFELFHFHGGLGLHMSGGHGFSGPH